MVLLYREDRMVRVVKKASPDVKSDIRDFVLGEQNGMALIVLRVRAKDVLRTGPKDKQTFGIRKNATPLFVLTAGPGKPRVYCADWVRVKQFGPRLSAAFKAS